MSLQENFQEVRLDMDFSVPQASLLKSLVDVALFALREKKVRLEAMEPSWTIGADDLRLLREHTERQIEEGHELLKHILSHASSHVFTAPSTLN